MSTKGVIGNENLPRLSVPIISRNKSEQVLNKELYSYAEGHNLTRRHDLSTAQYYSIKMGGNRLKVTKKKTSKQRRDLFALRNAK